MNAWLVLAIIIYLYAGIYDVYIERHAREDLHYPLKAQALDALAWPVAMPLTIMAVRRERKLYNEIEWTEDDDGTIYFDSEDER